MNHQRLLELDALRGLAALAVVFFHYFFRYNEIYGHEGLHVHWSHLGHFGAQLFFMVSGFVIFWTLNRVERPLDFIVSRCSRLYPAYWLSIFLTFSIIYFFGLPGREVSLNDALANTIMFHEYLGIPHVDGVYWTLTVELTFYFWIFLIYLSSNLNRVEEIFSIAVLISIFHSLEFFTVPEFLYKIFILKHLPLFLAGVCFYKLVNSCAGKKTVLALVLSLLSTLAIHSLKIFFLFFCFSVFLLLSIVFYGSVGALKSAYISTFGVSGKHFIFSLSSSSKYRLCNYQQEL